MKVYTDNVAFIARSDTDLSQTNDENIVHVSSQLALQLNQCKCKVLGTGFLRKVHNYSLIFVWENWVQMDKGFWVLGRNKDI